MKIAYATVSDILNPATWSKDYQGLCAAGYYLAKYLTDADTSIDYLGPLAKKFALLTRAKWSLYRHIYKKDYYRWAEPLVVKNYAYQLDNKLINLDTNIVLCPENIVPIAYLNCRQPIVLWTDATLTSLIDFYRHMDNVCAENIMNIYKFEAAALKRCELILYTSDWAAQSAIDTYGISPDKVKVIPWGANLECERTLVDIHSIIDTKNIKPCKLLFIGVDWVRKGGNIALAVAQELNNMGLPTQLIVVGCQPAVREQLPNFVKVVGFIDKSQREGLAEMTKLFTEAHFLILPSQADCSPHVFAEANSFGMPAVATNVGGIPTLIKENLNGKTFGLEASASDYSAYIYSVMNSYSEYKQLALSAFNEYESRLNWAVAARSAKELMRELLS